MIDFSKLDLRTSTLTLNAEVSTVFQCVREGCGSRDFNVGIWDHNREIIIRCSECDATIRTNAIVPGTD